MALSAAGLHLAMDIIRVEDQEIVNLRGSGTPGKPSGQDETDQQRGEIFFGH